MPLRDGELDQGLKELNLVHMAEIVKDLLRRAQDDKWSHKRLLRELIEAERAFRRQRALQQRIQRATLPEKWTLETFPFDRQPGVDRTLINQLAELDWVKLGINLVFIGGAGVGKTGLLSALLLKALLNGYTGIMQRTQDLLDDLHRSIADRKTKYLLNRLTRLDVLFLDEMGYLRLNEDQTNLFFKLMDDRYLAKKPTLITTNLGYDSWGQFLKNPPMVQALQSRLRHRCVTVDIKGPDLRTPA